MGLKLVIRWLAAVGAAASGVWLYSDPKAESWAGFAASAVVFLGSFFKSESGSAQNQTVSGTSIGLQAGRDVSAGTISQDKQ
jgi:hypothetical protein